MIDCQGAIDALEGFEIYSVLDIKAGFNNIPVPPDMQVYLGIITQDGLYVYLRMPFGINAAPCHFQACMNDILSKGAEPLPHSTYVDDCHLGGKTVRAAWKHTLLALERLTKAGMPISIGKCEFLTRRLKVLGMLLEG